MTEAKILRRIRRSCKRSGDCLLWKGSTTGGFPRASLHGRGVSPTYLHRLFWQLRYGEIPKGGIIFPRCQNKRCLNPEHWFLATPEEAALHRTKWEGGKRRFFDPIEEEDFDDDE